jgi:hypothetical protein
MTRLWAYASRRSQGLASPQRSPNPSVRGIPCGTTQEAKAKGRGDEDFAAVYEATQK